MCRVDYCDDEYTFVGSADPVARKEHRCDDCGRTIEPGERYHRATWASYGDLLTSKMCGHCKAASRWLTVVCSGFIWSQVIEELKEHWDEEFDLRSHGLGRLVAVGRRRWKRNGALVNVTDVERWVTSGLARVPAVSKVA